MQARDVRLLKTILGFHARQEERGEEAKRIDSHAKPRRDVDVVSSISNIFIPKGAARTERICTSKTNTDEKRVEENGR